MPPDLSGLRLLLIGDWPPPLGGVSVHLRALREAAREAAAQVTVLDIGQGRNEGEGLVPARSEARFAASLAALLRRHELVHLHTSGANPKSWLLISLVGRAARLSGVHPLVTLHSGHCPRWLTTPARALSARFALSPYERIVCVSDEIERALRRIGALGQRGLQTPAFGRRGLTPALLPAAAQTARQRHAPLISAMLGNTREYGGQELVQAFAQFKERLPDAGLVLYGAGSGAPDLWSLSAQTGARFTALGPIDHGAALALMQISDLFVRPTHVDGDAVSVREAMAMGARVVATRTGTRPPGITLCQPADAADLCRAMRLALASPASPSADSTDGVETLLALYADLTNRTHRPHAAEGI